LKPVVCRRVVGRLPPRPRREVVVYLVRSLGFQPEPSSHDWHVQPSCQRTESLPPERALSVQSRDTSASLPVLETCTNYASCAATVNPLRVQDFHLFSTTVSALKPSGLAFRTASAVRNLLRRSLSARDKTHLPHRARAHFGTSRGGRRSV